MPSESDSNGGNDIEYYYCRVCNEPFRSAARMKGHCLQQHGEPAFPEGWHTLRGSVLKEAEWKCQVCGEPSAKVGRLHVHHEIPRKCFDTEADSHFRANLTALCDSHHAIRENESDSCPTDGCDFSVSTCGTLKKTEDIRDELPNKPYDSRAIKYECPSCGNSYDFRLWIN